jgi:ABC-type sugar transport system permease subunit
MYRLAFFDLDRSKAAAVGMVMLAINLALAWIAVRMMRREGHS